MMVVIAGRSSSRQSFKRKVGIGSSGHDLLGDFFIKVRISSIVAGWKFCSCCTVGQGLWERSVDSVKKGCNFSIF